MHAGPDAPLVLEQGLTSCHMEHVYDFYKPAGFFPKVTHPRVCMEHQARLSSAWCRFAVWMMFQNLACILHTLLDCWQGPGEGREGAEIMGGLSSCVRRSQGYGTSRLKNANL